MECVSFTQQWSKKGLYINTDGTANDFFHQALKQRLIPNAANNSDKWNVPCVTEFCSSARPEVPIHGRVSISGI